MGKQTKDVRQLVVRLSPRRDRDIIEAIRTMPRGEPSDMVREGFRRMLGLAPETRPATRLTLNEAAPAQERKKKGPEVADLDASDW